MGCVFNFFYALLTLLLLLHTRFSLATDGEALKKCIDKERKALLLFKQGIYVDYGMLSTWRGEDDEDCCHWKGVHCSNQTGHVQVLNLRGSDPSYLRGTINITLLSKLHDLQHLDLSYNSFYPSDIPQSVGSFTNLRYLNLSYSDFVGSIPNQLGKLPNLQYIDMSNNYLDGAIPCQIGNLSKLQSLHLGGNNLVGVIPYQIGNLSILHTLRVGGYLSNLTIADKNNGDAEWISKLSLLTNLELSYVSDVGNSQVWQHMIGKLMPKLIELRLRDCGISHVHNLLLFASPSNYSYSLVTLDLSDNNLNSSLFQWSFNFSSNLQQLYLSNCSLSSHNLYFLSSHFHFPSLIVLDLSYNNLMSVTALSFGFNLQELYLSNCSLTSNNLIFTSFNPNLSSLIHLDLSDNLLTSSTIFYWISNFTFNPHELDLRGNSLGRSIPDGFGNVIKSLEVLDLSSNNLQGEVPTPLGNICTLKSLSLAYNNFSGDLPRFISNISWCNRHSLQSLDLSTNRLTGILPNLSSFSLLQDLDLTNNQLEGKIPESIGLMSQLESLRLGANNFSGVITESHFKNLSNLSHLSLSGNPLTLNISASWIPPFQLQFMFMASCMIGPNVPLWLRNQHQLFYLDISYGKLFGSIPEWFWPLLKNIAYMNISFNNFSGKIPNLPFKFDYRPEIILNSNNFEGGLPPFLWQASELHLSKNKFSNLIPLLCGQTEYGGIVVLDLSNNQLTGHLPECWNQLDTLKFVDMSTNNLSGEIPSSIGRLVNVEAMVLSNNSLIGELPLSLANCSKLVLLDVSENKLSGPIPSWIGISLEQLQILSLRMNHLNGSLPVHLCHLTQIRLLDISRNNLSNEVPSCLENFTVMAQEHINSSGSYHYYMTNKAGFYQYLGGLEFYITLMWKGEDYKYMRPELFLKSIDLSSNALSGEVPRELMSLLGLVSLNLSRNQLSGEIPINIGNLESLEFLDLSNNKLSGPIPPSLANIDRLSMLDLSNNRLYGKIPIGTQLQSFNASSYGGNLDLCGLPLNKMCPEDNTPPPQEANHDEEEGASLISQEFYLSMGLGFVVGFWAVVGPLLFNRTWRQAYCRFMNTVTDKVHVMVAIYVVKCLTIRD
ncbi:receptor-like protein EIX2 [Neltuma alba]|uniref:receptor-like protein EIX2 n=1 Tax=Neltuma alba TaxID=207710 RepID=UPI0010A46619|nr:receptor-like protein EIX2 [Prosopis alba]